jgi:hypothetical protein
VEILNSSLLQGDAQLLGLKTSLKCLQISSKCLNQY